MNKMLNNIYINYSMIKSLSKMMFYSSFFLCFSSNSFFFIWVCLEINLLMFISLFEKLNNTNTNSMMKYFIIQSLSSSLFIMSYLMMKYTLWHLHFLQFLLFNAMMIKMGIFPYSSWYFQVSENLNWNQWFLMNTLQKVMPLWVISFHNYSLTSMNLFIMMNSIYSFIEIWNQNSLRWMINASSLNHFSWMLISMNSQNSIWEFYFIIYLLVSLCLVIFLKLNNWNSISNMINNKNMMSMYLFFMTMMNFMGIPPFLGFLPKMLIFMNNQNLFICSLLIMINIILLVVYFYYCLAVTSKFILNKNHKLKTNQMHILNMNLMFLLLLIIL
nr:NADH dehydrogenase subunit 2 [Amblyseius tsugawai]